MVRLWRWSFREVLLHIGFLSFPVSFSSFFLIQIKDIIGVVRKGGKGYPEVTLPFRIGDSSVDDGSWWRVLDFLLGLHIKARVDSLLDNDHSQFGTAASNCR